MSGTGYFTTLYLGLGINLSNSYTRKLRYESEIERSLEAEAEVRSGESQTKTNKYIRPALPAFAFLLVDDEPSLSFRHSSLWSCSLVSLCLARRFTSLPPTVLLLTIADRSTLHHRPTLRLAAGVKARYHLFLTSPKLLSRVLG